MNQRLLDNPLLVKHARSRLRRQHVVPMLIALVLICGCVMWGGYADSELQNAGAFSFLLLIQGIVLMLAGSAQVASAVRQANTSGMLDFHRASPLPAWDLTIAISV